MKRDRSIQRLGSDLDQTVHAWHNQDMAVVVHMQNVTQAQEAELILLLEIFERYVTARFRTIGRNRKKTHTGGVRRRRNNDIIKGPTRRLFALSAIFAFIW